MIIQVDPCCPHRQQNQALQCDVNGQRSWKDMPQFLCFYLAVPLHEEFPSAINKKPVNLRAWIDIPLSCVKIILYLTVIIWLYDVSTISLVIAVSAQWWKDKMAFFCLMEAANWQNIKLQSEMLHLRELKGTEAFMVICLYFSFFLCQFHWDIQSKGVSFCLISCTTS